MEKQIIDIVDIFTDGSAHSQAKIGGWAALVVFAEKKQLLKGTYYNVTHQQMELQAAIEALHYLQDNLIKATSVNIYTDSQYLVNLPQRKEKLQAFAFKNKSGKPIANYHRVKKLYFLLESIPVSFLKQPAHQQKNSGYDENRKVDKIARKLVREAIKNN